MKRNFGMMPAAALALLMLTGCTSIPVVSDSTTWGTESAQEQRDWAAAEIDDVIRVIGESDGWVKVSNHELEWVSDRDRILRGADRTSCRPSRGSRQFTQLDLMLISREVADPFASAERVWAHWEREGWQVRYVIPPGSTQVKEEYFRADREDGAVLALNVTEHLTAIEVSSSCSEFASWD